MCAARPAARPAFATALIAGAMAFWGSASAIYIRPELTDVPVERLVQNLERQIASKPTDAQLHINLARLHGMAYALKTESATLAERPGQTDQKPDEIWYGFEPKHIPYDVQAAPNPEAQRKARAHLDASIASYQKALSLDPNNLTAALGLAWAQDQAGEKARAVEGYRRVIAAAWRTEGTKEVAGLGARFYTSEAAGYLIPLLDPAKDAAEIADLRNKVKTLERLPRPITPIIVPLDDDVEVADLTALGSRVRFDADGSGRHKPWSWITPRAAWLVFDHAGDGIVRSALQLFGNVTFWLFWDHGYQALAALDDDGDGELRGAELRGLSLWRDTNADGVSDAGEVRPLAAYGIEAVSCSWIDGESSLVRAWSRAGVRFRDGRTRPTYDVVLAPGATQTTHNLTDAATIGDRPTPPVDQASPSSFARTHSSNAWSSSSRFE